LFFFSIFLLDSQESSSTPLLVLEGDIIIILPRLDHSAAQQAGLIPRLSSIDLGDH
jgi:hypothetical protein